MKNMIESNRKVIIAAHRKEMRRIRKAIKDYGKIPRKLQKKIKKRHAELDIVATTWIYMHLFPTKQRQKKVIENLKLKATYSILFPPKRVKNKIDSEPRSRHIEGDDYTELERLQYDHNSRKYNF